MPDFETRTPQQQDRPNKLRSMLAATKLRIAWVANKLRPLLIGGGVLLFVAAVLVGPRIYSSPPQKTSEAEHCAGNGGTDRLQARHAEVSNGKIAFVREFGDATYGDATSSDIYVIDEEGNNETRLTHTARFEEGLVWSPDGEKIAFIAGVPSDIYVMDADGTDQTRLAPSPATRWAPAWSPDGKRMVFLSGPDIHVMDADGTDQTIITSNGSGQGDQTRKTNTYAPVWSPDGKKIGFASKTVKVTSASASAGSSSASAGPSSAPAEGLTGIYISNADGTGLCKLTSISDTHAGEAGPTWSPDGNKIAFYDPHAIYLINDDGTGRKALTGNILDPPLQAWSPDGERIAFVKGLKLYVINADGTGMRRLASYAADSVPPPTWSPDGEKIAFPCPGPVGTEFCVINADGTGLKHIVYYDVPSAAWGRE